jgi:hypothetical protein
MRKTAFDTPRRWAGHATAAMQRRYTHLDADTAGDAADAIGRFW